MENSYLKSAKKNFGYARYMPKKDSSDEEEKE